MCQDLGKHFFSLSISLYVWSTFSDRNSSFVLSLAWMESMGGLEFVIYIPVTCLGCWRGWLHVGPFDFVLLEFMEYCFLQIFGLFLVKN